MKLYSNRRTKFKEIEKIIEKDLNINNIKNILL